MTCSVGKQMGIAASDAIQEFRLDEVADEYTSWRNAWAGTLGGDEGAISRYKAARSGFYNLLENFYARTATASPFLVGEGPRYTDFAVVGIMSDDQTVYGTWDFGCHPMLHALCNSMRKSPALSKFFPK